MSFGLYEAQEAFDIGLISIHRRDQCGHDHTRELVTSNILV